MQRTDAMLNRLPTLYRDGELVRGVLAQPAVQIEIAAEDGIDIQRAHFFDAALELADVAGLAAVLDMAPEPWQGRDDFRAWVHAQRNALLRGGAVPKRALENFVVEFGRSYQEIIGANLITGLGSWSDAPSVDTPALIENPQRRRLQLAAVAGVEPLAQFSIENRGLDEATAGFLLTGMATAPEYVPVIANLTTGQALVFVGSIGVGQRLWLLPQPDGTVLARREHDDTTAALYSLDSLQPGVPWEPSAARRPAQAIRLARGRNDLWFLTVAHYDAPGLDRALLALADVLLEQGRYDRARLDHALFYQEPAAMLWTTWVEHEPASFEIQLPGGALRNRAGPQGLSRVSAAMLARKRLLDALDGAVAKLRAAGVRSSVQLRDFGETQPQGDRLVAVMPIIQREVGPTGADRLPEAGGMFEITDFDQSTFR